MATSFTHSWTYDAPLDTVRAMLLDPKFREAVCDAQHTVSHEVRINGTKVDVDTTRSTRGVPAFVTKLSGDTISMNQREVWTGNEATFELLLPGKPGSVVGMTSLKESGGSTVQTVEAAVTARIPLIGGKLEAFIRDMIIKAMDREARTGREWLS